MKRIMFLAVTALASGCTIGTSGPPVGDLTLYWDFQRSRLDGTTVRYDTNVVPGGVSRACPESDVDTISIAYSNGTLVDPSAGAIPCIFGDAYSAGVQGATIPGMSTGVHDLVVTGYHHLVGTSQDVATFKASFQVTVVEGRSVEYSITLPGIPDDLDVNALFYDSLGGSQLWTSCGSGAGGANVQTLTYNLVDGAGTSVTSGTVTCADPAGLSFRVANGQGVERDGYSIRLQAFRTGTATPILDSATTALSPPCTAQSFGHYGSDVGAYAWGVKLYDVTGNPTRCQ